MGLVVPETRITVGVNAMAFARATRKLAVGTGLCLLPLSCVSCHCTTDLKLWTLNTASNVWRWEWTLGVMDGNVTALTFTPEGKLFIGNDGAVDYQDTTSEFNRIGGLDGLPQCSIVFCADDQF